MCSVRVFIRFVRGTRVRGLGYSQTFGLFRYGPRYNIFPILAPALNLFVLNVPAGDTSQNRETSSMLLLINGDTLLFTNAVEEPAFPLRCLQNKQISKWVDDWLKDQPVVDREAVKVKGCSFQPVDWCAYEHCVHSPGFTASRTRLSIMGNISISDSIFENVEKAFLCLPLLLLDFYI